MDTIDKVQAAIQTYRDQKRNADREKVSSLEKFLNKISELYSNK
jgi:hypothetical protein